LKDISYIGEHLWAGNLGHFLIITAFISAIFSSIGYFLSAQNEVKNPEQAKNWLSFSRKSFWIHAISVLGVFGMLFIIIYFHFFEYNYAYSHSSTTLPVQYIVSSFWEGQEGSFLLWMLWHSLIGLVLMYSAKKWESRTLSILSLIQIILGSMLIGVYVGDLKIGSSPFILVRETMANAPIFQNPDYLKLYLTNGNGLNPLLQNFWMTIHPPVLFLGFATTAVPFSFALASLWKKDYQSWIYPALPWTIFNICILGIGIMMGGMWAYESLNFGGYWAWDPVENASLVPWLVMVAGLHTLIIFKNTQKALFSTYLLLISGFFLILYATFLTRSGILGESSVHSFTDLGLSGQLLILLIGLGVVGYGIFFLRRKEIPAKGKVDEQIASREFWLYTGAMILFVSAFQIITSTSIPVINKVFGGLYELIAGPIDPKSFEWAGDGVGNALYKFFGGKLAPPKDVHAHYHKFQIPLAILILALTVVAQIIKYKKDQGGKVFKRLYTWAAISIIPSIAVFYFSEYQANQWIFLLYLWACFFSILGNGSVFVSMFKNIKKQGASITHIGFAVMLFGVLISSANKKVISINNKYTYGDKFQEKDTRENLYLKKNVSDTIGKHIVTYLGDTVAEPNHYYKIKFQNGSESFVLQPNAQLNPKMGLISNPDTKHYLYKDIFTYVSQVTDKSKVDQEENQLPPKEFSMNASGGDTLLLKNNLISLTKIEPGAAHLSKEEQKVLENAQAALTANFNCTSTEGRSFSIKAVYAVVDNKEFRFDGYDEESGLRISVNRLNIDPNDPTKASANFTAFERKEAFVDYVILKAIEFPWIQLVWWGSMIMMIGFYFSIMHRYRETLRFESKNE
jgi:cytochrome c-type biogenesis protein CcmF